MAKALNTLLLATFVFWLSALSAQAAKIDVLQSQDIGYDVERTALVIGNSDYEFITDLDNTINDSSAIALSLQKVGFNVFHAQDVTRRDLNDAIDRFLTSVKPGSEALIYYAGHGVELDGENYLLPTDIRQLKPSQRRRLREESVGLNQLLADLRARKARVNLVLLDACRDNPFPKENTRSLGGGTGLGRIDPPHGTVVVYAAAAGEKALDKLNDEDTNPNGLFTRHLLQLIEQPGLEIRPLVQELKERVYTEAKTASLRSQRPSYYDGLIGKFYFQPKVQTVALTLKHPCEVSVDPNARKDAVMRNDYSAIVPLCREAIVLYPENSVYRNLLRSAEEQLSAQKAMSSADSQAALSYMQTYGNGRFMTDVALHLATLGSSTDKQVARQPQAQASVPQVAAVQSAPAQQAPQTQVAPVQVQVQTAARGDARAAVAEPTTGATTNYVAGPVLSPREISFEIQSELNRIGCSAGKPDGLWGKRSAAAARNYLKFGNARLASLDPTSELLNILRQENGTVCPVTCSAREDLQNGQCVVKTCGSGQRLSSKGQCYTPKANTVRTCRSGQLKNSKGVCYTPKKRATKRTTTRKAAAPAQKKYVAPQKTKRAAKPSRRGVSGYNYQCKGAGPGLC